MGKRTEGGTKVLRWVEALQQGRDVEANSRRVFRFYFSRIRSFFAGRLRDSERAEELAQDTFFQAFQRINSFRRDGSFDSWLFGIAANLLRNEWRRLSRKKHKADEPPPDGDEPQSLGPADVGDSPEKGAATRERVRLVMAVIENLPQKPRDCLRLHLAGYGYGKIGELLKMAPSTARVHVHAARKRLRSQFPDAADWLD